MSSRTFSGILMSLLLIGTFTLAFDVRPALAQLGETIYINADGSISPPMAPINTLDNVTYVLVDNLNEGITVQRSNIVINGNGHTLNGPDITYGFNLTNVEDVTIKNVTISDCGTSVYFNSSSGNTLSNIVIANSFPEGMDMQGIVLLNTNDSQIVNNSVVDSDMGVRLQSCFGNNVSGNIGNENDAGVALLNSCNNILSNNHFEGGLFVGGFLYFSNNNTLSGNYFSRYPLESGLELSSSDDNKLIGNDVTGNGRGIYLQNSDNNTLIANTAAYSYGVPPGGAGPPAINLQLESSSNNTILENTIAYANTSMYWFYVGEGMGVYSSSNNTIYHNNFIGNVGQVGSDGSPNMWDNGYPSGGNYWSDYNGTDHYGGPYQNVTGSDGIGDTSYSIDADNADHYPLMNLYSPSSFHVAKAVVGQGFSVSMYFAEASYDDYPETFNVTVYANSTLLASENLTFTNGNTNVTFTWNTTGFAYGTYNLTAYAWSVANETNTANNNFTGGLITVSIPGDLNGDFTVSRADAILLTDAYGSEPGDVKWNPNADINGDGKVSLQDLVILAQHYGQHYP
jgi:parallel beta-helix repeat protein